MQDKTKIFNAALNLQITGKAKEVIKLYLKLIKRFREYIFKSS